MSEVKLESLIPDKPEIKYGWQCPVCGAVMAPHVAVCINCSGNNIISINTNTGIVSVTTCAQNISDNESEAKKIIAEIKNGHLPKLGKSNFGLQDL